MPNLKDMLGEEAFKALPEDVRKQYQDVDLVNSADYVPKSRFSQVNDEKNEYKKQVGERDKQLGDLQKKVKDNEELTKEIEKLRNDNSTTTADYEKKIEQIQFDMAIDNALKSSNVKDAKLIKALLDNEKIKVTNGEVIGLKEQLEIIKAERDYLFEKEVPGTGNPKIGGKTITGGGEKSLGERLAQEKAEQLKTSEAASKFFK